MGFIADYLVPTYCKPIYLTTSRPQSTSSCINNININSLFIFTWIYFRAHKLEVKKVKNIIKYNK